MNTGDGAEAMANHLKECRQVDAVIAHDGNADQLVASMVAAGWTYNGVEYLGGKRIRYMTPPPGWVPPEVPPRSPELGKQARS